MIYMYISDNDDDDDDFNDNDDDEEDEEAIAISPGIGGLVPPFLCSHNITISSLYPSPPTQLHIILPFLYFFCFYVYFAPHIIVSSTKYLPFFALITSPYCPLYPSNDTYDTTRILPFHNFTLTYSPRHRLWHRPAIKCDSFSTLGNPPPSATSSLVYVGPK